MPAKAAPAKTTTRTPRKAAPRKAVRDNSLVKVDPKVKTAVRPPRKKPAKAALPVVPEEPKVPLSLTGAYIGKRRYNLLVDPTCPICRHPKRALIEEQILLNVQMAAIARWVSGRRHENIDGSEEEWPEVTAEQLIKHFKNDHSPLDASFIAEAMEQQVDLDEYKNVRTRFVNGLAFAHRVIGRVEERMVNGEIEPTMKDATAMARLATAAQMAKAQTAQAEQQDQSWFYEQAVQILMGHAETIMDAKQYDRFLDALRGDPTLRTL